MNMNTTKKSGADAKKLQAAGVRYGRSHQRREAKERARIRSAIGVFGDAYQRGPSAPLNQGGSIA
jgi:hypothetical protein